MSRSLRLTLYSVAVFLAVVCLGASVAVWRLSAGPIRVASVSPYIEKVINHYIPNTHTEVGKSVLTWDNVNRSIALHAENLTIRDENGVAIAEIPVFDVSLSAWGLLIGKFMPLSLGITHPQFKLERDSDGVLRFGGVTSQTMASKSENHGDFESTTKRLSYYLSHALLIRSFHVDRLVLDVHDAASQSNWAISVPEINLESTSEGLAGHTEIELTQKEAVSTLDVRYQYDRGRSLHVLETRLNGITPSFFAGGNPQIIGLGIASVFNLPLSGTMSASVDNDFIVREVKLDVHGDAGTLNDPDLWDNPRAITSADLKAEYADATLKASSLDLDFGGPKLSATATGVKPIAPGHDLDFILTAQLDHWPMDQFGDLWPKPIIPNPRAWIAANLSKGVFEHGEALFKGSLAWKDLANMEVREGGGQITAKGARVHYLDGMTPIDGVNADATFDLDQMTVKISGGGIGDLRLEPFTIQLTDFEKPVQYIDIPLKVAGPIPDVMRLIDEPRLNYAKAIGLKPDEIAGSVEGTVTLHFPLLNDLLMKDVSIDADAKLSNVASSVLVKGIDISQGDLSLALNKEGYTIKGPAFLNKIPFKIVWHENFEEKENQLLKEANITGTVTDDQWASLGIDALKNTHGPTVVTLDLSQPTKAKTILNGKLDFTAADLSIDQLNWKKPAAAPALVKVSAEVNEGQNITVTSIEADGPQMTIRGNAVLTPKGDKPLAINLDPATVGRTNVSFHFAQGTEDASKISFEAQGEALDISGLKGGHDPERADPRPKEYKIDVGKLYTSDTGFITSAKGYAVRDPEGWSEINLSGLADGDHQLNMDLASRDGKRIFAVACDDFGKTLKGLGITDTVTGGTVDIHGESTADNVRVIEGKASIGQFTVKDLPALAVLLNAASPFGLPNLLAGTMDFSRLKGKFRWQGDTIELMGVRAVATSVALNINGKVDMNAGNADLNGTIVPFSMINSVLGSIPLLGNVITGGNGGGILAVSYTVTGPLNNPNVGVNPVSLLTPGFLRNIFFGSGDDTDEGPRPASAEPENTSQPPAKTNINP